MMRDLEVCAPQKNQIQRIDVTTTAANTALIAGVKGIGWIRVKAVTANVQLYFSTSGSDAVALDAASGDTCGWPLLAGQSEDYYITNESNVAWDADATGQLYICRAGINRTGQR